MVLSNLIIYCLHDSFIHSFIPLAYSLTSYCYSAAINKQNFIFSWYDEIHINCAIPFVNMCSQCILERSGFVNFIYFFICRIDSGSCTNIVYFLGNFDVFRLRLFI